MKNKLCSIAAFALITLAIGCKKSAIDNTQPTHHSTARLSPEQENYIAIVGDQHTKGLQYAYNYLVDLKNTSPSTFDSAINLLPAIKGGIHSFYTGNEISWINGNSDSAISGSDAGFDEATVSIGHNLDYWNTHNFWKPSQDSLLSSTAKSLLTDLRTIMLDSNKTLEQSLLEITNLEETANNNVSLDSQELALVRIATSVGKSSLTYWLQNYNDWVTLIGNNVVWKGAAQKTGNSAARTAGATDVGVAVGTAATVGIYAFFHPVTAVAAFSLIIGGTIGSSIAAGITTAILNR
jgi:hypothetical protein